jgi:predicted cupin superfamily sugar epimerase
MTAPDPTLPDRGSIDALTAGEVISLLDLKPHPEGGYFRETFRDERTAGDGRAASTAIYFLLTAGERSHWHRVDAAEVWHHYAGAALDLSIFEGTATLKVRLGPDIAAGDQPQVVVPAQAWQAAESLGEWTLVGCTVAPGFEFKHFELAQKDWSPGQS